MNLQSNAIQNGLVILFAFILAIWLGVSVVTEQVETLITFGGVALLLTCIFLGRKIWLLMIVFGALNVPIIRGFGTEELGQTLFIGFSMIILLMRRLPLKVTFGEKEFWVFLIAASVVQVYLRNPVGLNIFGAASVGAKPYFVIAVSFLSSIILASLRVNPNEIKWAFRLHLLGSFLGPAPSYVRTGGGGGAVQGVGEIGGMDQGASGRAGGLGGLGIKGAYVLISFISPLRALLHPFWTPVLLFSLAAAAASGYRNIVAQLGIIYILGLAYRNGFGAVLVSSISFAFFLGLLAFVNVVNPLPPNVQRALSPFPGTWEERYVNQAESSTKWRVEMWKEALFTEHWIQNKILGDGLGFTRRELELAETRNEGGAIQGQSFGTGLSSQQESMMVSGAYHSGPVQTVRTTGYVGLAILVLAMIRMAVYAHRQIIRCRNTEWYSMSMYFGIPVLVLPIMFVFVFGDFSSAVSGTLLSYALISLFEKNLPLPAYVKSRHVPYILKRGNQAAC